MKPFALTEKEYDPAETMLNTHKPCESDFTVKHAVVLWLVSAHSAPGTAAPLLSRIVARTELETFCASAILTAHRKSNT